MIADEELLYSFANAFFGYGNLEAPIWFVGMEEGGGTSVGEINARLTAWNQRGRRCVEDLPEFCRATRVAHLNQWFDPRSNIQRTWNRLILMSAVLMGKEPLDLESRKVIQRSSFAREQENESLLELFPFPSPGIRQ
ncbi:hypothetical protein SAMN05421753_111181 [Planctomicrobium piriforme]|uniref:Uncharacterized protein n=2 Tax=Planctomicrobium piriforme TaxID=1576369 RepID=A0A1I3KBV9_9PLAN|nr:hypothetical protein SAMN05421753_111181 [Planctomicrobium piriforme]